MSNPTILASAKIAGDPITVELIDSGSVTITWPSTPLSISKRRFPDLAATLTRLFANASTELARLKAGDRL
jgi:hypothetical protein